jgi:hypothetical protein
MNNCQNYMIGAALLALFINRNKKPIDQAQMAALAAGVVFVACRCLHKQQAPIEEEYCASCHA